MKLGLRCISIFLLSFGLIAHPGVEAQESFKIGVIQSLTSFAAEDGQTVVNSVRLAQKKLKADKGYLIDLIIEDDQSQAKQAVSAFQRLKAQNVDAVIGATWSFTFNAVLPLAAQTKTVLFSSSNLTEALNLSEGLGFAFNNAMTCKEEAKPFESFLLSKKPKDLVIVYANNSWGETQFRIYKQIAESQKIQILDSISTSAIDENELGVMVAKIKAKAPQIVLLLLNKADLDVFLRRASELKLKSEIFASKNLYDAFRMSQMKAIYEHTCFTYPLEQIQREAEFLKMYKSSYNEEPKIYADYSYDALFLLIEAIRSARSQKIGLEQALQHISYTGIVGNYIFNESSSLSLGKASLVCIENQKFIMQGARG